MWWRVSAFKNFSPFRLFVHGYVMDSTLAPVKKDYKDIVFLILATTAHSDRDYWANDSP